MPFAFLFGCRLIDLHAMTFTFRHAAEKMKIQGIQFSMGKVNKLTLQCTQSSQYHWVITQKLDRRLDSAALVKDTVFGQVYAQMRGFNCTHFRRPKPKGAAPHIAFQCIMDGETVLGTGGPYRILFQEIAEELQECASYTDAFPLALFAPTPNSQHSVGESRGSFLPHPSATSVVDLEAFEFLGRLLGIAIRTKVLLALNFPPLFWTLLTGRTPTRNHLREVNQTLVESVLTPTPIKA
jgi:hypothetical protein